MLLRPQFNQYKATKYATPSPSYGGSVNSSVSFGSGGSRSTPGSTGSYGSPAYGSTPKQQKNAYQVDIADYSPSTAVVMQRAQIEKLTRIISDLKAAELDLAATELEDERRRMSEVMTTHNAQIEELKDAITGTTDEVEATWQAKVDDMRNQMTDMEYARDQLENEKGEVEGKLGDAEAANDELQNSLDECQDSLKDSLGAKQRMQQQVKLASADLDLKMKEKADELAEMTETLNEYEQNQSEQLQQARSEAAGFQSDLQDATAQIEQLSAQLAEAQTSSNSDLHDARGQIEQLSAQLTEAQTSSNSQLEQSGEQIEQLSAQLVQAQTSFNSQIEQSADQIKQLSAQLTQTHANSAAQLEQLSAQLAEAEADAQSRDTDMQQQLADASGVTATQNESMANLESNMQSELASLNAMLSSKTQIVETYEVKIGAAGAQSLDGLISAKASAEANVAVARTQLVSLSEQVSKLQRQVGSEERDSADFALMVQDLKEQEDLMKEQVQNLVDERDIVQSQLQIADDRCTDLESRCAELTEQNVTEKETNAEVWGNAQKARESQSALEKQLRTSKDGLTDAKVQQIELQQTIVDLQEKLTEANDKERAAVAEAAEATTELDENLKTIEDWKSNDTDAINKLTDEIADLKDTNMDLDAANNELAADSDRAVEVVQQCHLKMTQLVPLAAMIDTDSISTACEQLLSTATDAMAAHDIAVARATKDAQEATMQLTAIEKTNSNSSNIHAEKNEKTERKLKAAKAELKGVTEERDNLGEQNAFLHMDVSNLTNQLTGIIAERQTRDEKTMRLEAEVERLALQLDSMITERAEQTETQVQIVHSHGPAKTVYKEVIKEVEVVREVEVEVLVQQQLADDEDAMPRRAVNDNGTAVLPPKMRMKQNVTPKYEQMVAELRGTIQETSNALANANADKEFIRDQFQDCLEQVEKMAVSLENETEAKEELEHELEHLRTECQILAKDSEQMNSELALANAQAAAISKQFKQSGQATARLQQQLNESVAAVKMHDLDAHVAHEQLEQLQNEQRTLRNEVDEANGTMNMEVWEKGVAMEKLRERTQGELAEATATAAAAQEALRTELLEQQLTSNESIINLQARLTATQDDTQHFQTNVHNLEDALEEQTMMYRDAQLQADDAKEGLRQAVAQNNELIQTLATVDADTESDLQILHERILKGEARYQQLEQQFNNLTGELQQFAADVDDMAGNETLGAVGSTPRAAAALLGFTDAAGGWQEQLKMMKDRIATMSEGAGNDTVNATNWTDASRVTGADSEISQEISHITSPMQDSVNNSAADAQKQAMGQFVQQLAGLYKQEQKASADMAKMLKTMSAKAKSTPGRTPGRRGLSVRDMNTAGSTPTKGGEWTKTLDSLQTKHASIAGVQDQVMDQLTAMQNFVSGDMSNFQPVVMNMRVDTSVNVAQSPNLSINISGVNTTPQLTKVGSELNWWTSLSNTGRKTMLAAAPSGQELGLFIDGETRWDKTMKLRILSPEKEMVPGATDSVESGMIIGSGLEIDGLKKQLANAQQQLDELQLANVALQFEAAVAKDAPPTPVAAAATAASPTPMKMNESSVPVGLPFNESPAVVAAAAASPVYVDAVPMVSGGTPMMPGGTPEWGNSMFGNLTPLHDGVFGDEQIAALSYSVNKELSALHQRAVEANLIQQAEVATPASAPRRELSEIQETILGHISELSNCVAEAIREWNGEATSPAGKDAGLKLGSLKQQAVALSAAFQRSMGSSVAGWVNPAVQHFADEAPATVTCPMPVPLASNPFAGPIESAQRSLQFDGGSSVAASDSYQTQKSMGYLLNINPSPFANQNSGYAPESDMSEDMSGDGLAASLPGGLPPTVSHFETASQAAQATLSAVMVDQRSMQTSPMQDDAGRCKALRRALVKAHEDYVKTAAAEKQVIEQLTHEIERLQGSLHTCISRERSKDDKWGSWVRAIFKLCCDPANPEGAPLEATSGMMMAVEQFIVGHHEQVKDYEGQVVTYERNLGSMVEQKMYLTRVLSIYEEIQEDATRSIQMLGSGSNMRAPTAPPTLGNLEPLTRFRVAVLVVIACGFTATR